MLQGERSQRENVGKHRSSATISRVYRGRFAADRYMTSMSGYAPVRAPDLRVKRQHSLTGTSLAHPAWLGKGDWSWVIIGGASCVFR